MTGYDSRVWRKGLLLLTAGATLASITIVILLATYDPSYEANFGEVSDPHDVDILIDLGKRLKRVRAWKPVTESEQSALTLARMFKETPVSRVLGLMRRPEEEDALAPQIQSLNEAVILLSRKLDDGQLKNLSNQKEGLVASHFDRSLRLAVEQQREEAYRALASAPEAAAVLDRYKTPRVPCAPSYLRSVAHWLHGEPFHDLENWVVAINSAVDRDVAPIAEWYSRLRETAEFPLGDAGNAQLFFRKMTYADNSRDAINYQRRSSQIDVTVWFRRKTQATGEEPLPSGSQYQPWVEVDTGLRLFAAPVLASAEEVAGAMPRSGPMRIDWQHTSVTVVPEAVADFLRSHQSQGISKAFSIRDLAVTTVKDRDFPVFQIDYLVVHRDVNTCQWRDRLILNANNPGDILEQASRLGQSAIVILRQHLPQLTDLRGMRVAISPLDAVAAEEDNPDAFACEVKPEGMPSIPFQVSIGHDGHLSWTGRAKVTDLVTIVRQLCQNSQDLQDVLPLLEIESVNLDSGAACLVTGKLAIRGKVAGMDDDWGQINWSLSSDGRSVVRLAAPEREYLARLRKIPPAVQPTRLDVGQLHKMALDHLQNQYPDLIGHVEIVQAINSSYGVLLTLGLTIGDWPALTLGPVVVPTSDSLPHVIDTLLSSRGVSESAKRLWSQPIPHPRYGQVSSTLGDWSPRPCHAKISCALELPVVGTLDWEEELESEKGAWKMMLSEELCRKLQPHINDMQKRISDFAIATVGAKIKLSVERNAFGAGRWLRLNPPAIAFQGQCEIPLLPFAVELGQVMVDAHGPHWPDEIAVSYLTSFPTPYCCVSDPSVRVNIPRRGLKIGCKLTPPSIKLGSSGNIVSSVAQEASSVANAELLSAYGLRDDRFRRLRLDNPWLHVIYLQGELGGSFRDQELEADATLRALDHYDAAHGRLTVKLQDQRLDATLQTMRAPFEGFPRLDGNLTMATGTGMTLHGTAEIAGYELRGRFEYQSYRQPANVYIHGRMVLPVVGDVAVTGESDLRFEHYSVTSRGTVPSPFPFTNVVDYEFIADELGYGLRWNFHTDIGVVTYAISSPTAKGLSETEILGEIERALQEARQADQETQPLTKEEKVWVKELPAASRKSPQQPPPDLQPPGVAKSNVSPPITPRDGTLEVTESGGDICFCSTSTGKEYLRVKAEDSAVGKHKNNYYVLWDRDPGAELLLFDLDKKKIRLLHCKSRTAVDSHEDLTKPLESFLLLISDSTKPNDQRELARQVAIIYAELSFSDKNPVQPQGIANGYVISFADPDKKDAHPACFFWSSKGTPNRAYIYDSCVPHQQRTEKFYRRLSSISIPAPYGLVVDAEPMDEGKLALLWPIHSWRWALRYDVGKPDVRPLEIEFLEGEERPKYVDLAKACVNSNWRNGVALAGKRALFGPEGACIFDSEGFHLLPTGDAMDGHKHPQFLPRSAFDQWPKDTWRFLPSALQDANTRRAMSADQIARRSVTDWKVLKNQQDGWGVNPMGLLLGLLGE